jgi:hypothetical protein
MASNIKKLLYDEERSRIGIEKITDLILPSKVIEKTEENGNLHPCAQVAL